MKATNEGPDGAEASAAPPFKDWAEKWAKDFHDTYERSAPAFGYETRKESAKPWADVPENNRKLMIAVCAEVLCRFEAERTALHPQASAAPPSEREAAMINALERVWDSRHEPDKWSLEVSRALELATGKPHPFRTALQEQARAAVPQAAPQTPDRAEAIKTLVDDWNDGVLDAPILLDQAYEFGFKAGAAAVPAPGRETRAAELTWPQLQKVVTASAEAYGYLKADESPVAKKLGEALERVVNVLLLATENDARIEAAYQRTYEHAQEQHKTVPIQVWADVDEGIVEIVRHLNTIPGVRTQASCQGTNKYAAYIMAEWSAEVEATLAGMYDLEFLGEHWGYVRARAGATAPPKEG